MPASMILTPVPVLITAASTQAMTGALDVSSYDYLDLVIYITSSGGGAGVSVVTGANLQDDTSWVQAATFAGITTVTTTGAAVSTSTQNSVLLRYVRWKVTSLTTQLAFFIRGVGRRRS